jgi:predicted nucleic acid-binding protein
VLRWQLLGQKLSESQASVAVDRLGGWHLRHASVAPLVQAAWSYRHNLTAADALYVALAEQLGASMLTDDHRLTRAPTFPSHVPVLQLPASL